MGYQATQPKATNNSATDSIFGLALAQACLGVAFGPEVSDAWEAAETASAIYTDRHSSSVQTAARTNGTIELGVKNTLAPVFGRQTRPAPDVDLKDIIPFWQKEPALRRQRGCACAR